VSDPRFSGQPVPTPRFADDDGSADPALAALLARFAAGDATREEAHAALAGARLLVPVVAVLDEAETGDDGLRREKDSHMATVSMVGAGGRRALLAFTGVEAMRAWDPAARPIAALAPEVCAAALDQGEDAVLVDVAGPVRFAVTDAALVWMAGRAPTAG